MTDVNQTATPDLPFPDQVPLLRPNEDPAINGHFHSGVYLDVGLSHIILSMLLGKLSTLVKLFGYKGDRKTGLQLLMCLGGWNDMPGVFLLPLFHCISFIIKLGCRRK